MYLYDVNIVNVRKGVYLASEFEGLAYSPPQMFTTFTDWSKRCSTREIQRERPTREVHRSCPQRSRQCVGYFFFRLTFQHRENRPVPISSILSPTKCLAEEVVTREKEDLVATSRARRSPNE